MCEKKMIQNEFPKWTWEAKVSVVLMMSLIVGSWVIAFEFFLLAVQFEAGFAGPAVIIRNMGFGCVCIGSAMAVLMVLWVHQIASATPPHGREDPLI